MKPRRLLCTIHAVDETKIKHCHQSTELDHIKYLSNCQSLTVHWPTQMQTERFNTCVCKCISTHTNTLKHYNLNRLVNAGLTNQLFFKDDRTSKTDAYLGIWKIMLSTCLVCSLGIVQTRYDTKTDQIRYFQLRIFCGTLAHTNTNEKIPNTLKQTIITD